MRHPGPGTPPLERTRETALAAMSRRTSARTRGRSRAAPSRRPGCSFRWGGHAKILADSNVHSNGGEPIGAELLSTETTRRRRRGLGRRKELDKWPTHGRTRKKTPLREHRVLRCEDSPQFPRAAPQRLARTSRAHLPDAYHPAHRGRNRHGRSARHLGRAHPSARARSRSGRPRFSCGAPACAPRCRSRGAHCGRRAPAGACRGRGLRGTVARFGDRRTLIGRAGLCRERTRPGQCRWSP